MGTVVPLLFCEDTSPVFFNLFDFTIAPPLLYYAYIPILILTLIFSTVALRSNHFDRNSRLLTGLALSLAFWVFVTFLQWIAAPITLVTFSWQLWNLANALTFLFAAFFVYSFVFNKMTPPLITVGFLILQLPIILLTPTPLNVWGFDFDYCEGIMNTVILSYTYFFDVVVMLFIAWIGLTAGSIFNKKFTVLTARQIRFVAFSALTFLFLFFATTLWGDLIDNYSVEIIAPIGAVIFLATMTHVSINYKGFNIKLLATESFVVGLIATVGSMLFLRTIEYVRYIAGASLIVVTVLGWLLSRSVRREIRQREEIEQLAGQLKKANDRLKILDKMKSEFVSIASHQLRSPLTSIRGYASMLLEGSFGNLSVKAKEALQRIADSSKYMALSVEDYLNVSRIEAGNMKYEYSDFDLKQTTSTIVDELRPTALKKGLLLIFKTNISGSPTIHADIGKTRQVILNLLDNSIKYTPKGTITMTVYDDVKNKRVGVSITDTGVGMDKEALSEVFDKFIRAKNANEVNVTGTGLGLFVAKKMVDQMSGRIWAESEGEGRGSTFYVEFPRMSKTLKK